MREVKVDGDPFSGSVIIPEKREEDECASGSFGVATTNSFIAWFCRLLL